MDYKYKAKVGKKYLKGEALVDNAEDADEFESSTEPTQRLNQMKRDGKLSKRATIRIIKEDIEDFDPENRDMYTWAKAQHDATGAVRKHSGDPYWVHPEGVAKIVAAYGGDHDEISCALAHDTMEDTGASYEDIAKQFGPKVADLVREVTNAEGYMGMDKEDYMNMELMELSPSALLVKLSDILYNLSDYPTASQKERMIRNIEYLVANRDLDDRCRELVNDLAEQIDDIELSESIKTILRNNILRECHRLENEL